MVLTKRLFVTFDGPGTWSPEEISRREVFVAKMIAEGKIDGKLQLTPTTIQRDFVDQAAAEEYLVALSTWNSGRTIVSSSITDI